MPLSEVRISPLDRGYHFGDGIYEVFRLYSGRLFMEAAHWRRCERSLSEMKIDLPDLEGVKAKCRQLAQLHPLKDAMLYLQITRGIAAKREHGFPKSCTAQVLAMVNELPVVLPKVKAEGCSVITQPDQRWKRCDIKSLNLLGNIMGATAAREAGCYEAIFINDLNQVSECSRSNVFAVVNGELRTMPTTGNILPGISRLLVLDLARQAGLAVREQAFTRDELFAATEVFLTNTTADLYPIAKIDDKVVGNGKPGPISTQLMERFDAYVKQEMAEPEFVRPSPATLPSAEILA